MAKIYRVIQIKLCTFLFLFLPYVGLPCLVAVCQRELKSWLIDWISQFKKISIWSLTYQQSVFKRYHGDKHFSEFLPTRWRQKSTGINMEHNYVTISLCIVDCNDVRHSRLPIAALRPVNCRAGEARNLPVSLSGIGWHFRRSVGR